jgi:precorrin-6A synthase
VDTLVVMLDAECAFQALPAEGVSIWWGAYLGMANQITDHGALAETAPRILQKREAARRAHGWIMDIYLLRRQAAAQTHSARAP